MQLSLPRLLTPALLVLGACAAHAPQISSSTTSPLKENPGMSTSTTPSSQAPAPLSQSTRTAAELLQGLLDLFRASKSADDFTMDAVSKALGVPMQRFDANSFGAGATLTPEWDWSLEITVKPNRDAPRLNFAFRPSPTLGSNAAPSMTDICQMDFDQFSKNLENMGFKRTPYYAEHGRHLKIFSMARKCELKFIQKGKPMKLSRQSPINALRVFEFLLKERISPWQLYLRNRKTS